MGEGSNGKHPHHCELSGEDEAIQIGGEESVALVARVLGKTLDREDATTGRDVIDRAEADHRGPDDPVRRRNATDIPVNECELPL